MLKAIRKSLPGSFRYFIGKPHFENGNWKFGLVHCYSNTIIGTEVNYQGMVIPRLMGTSGTMTLASVFKLSDQDYMDRLLKQKPKRVKKIKMRYFKA